MSLNVNTVILAGNLTRDPELKTFAPDRMVAHFGLAINRRWKNADGEAKEEATFVDIEAWGRVAEIVSEYLTKGAPCYVEGRLRLDTWEKDGVRQQRLKVVAERIQLMGKGRERGEAAQDAPAAVEGREDSPTPASPRNPVRIRSSQPAKRVKEMEDSAPF